MRSDVRSSKNCGGGGMGGMRGHGGAWGGLGGYKGMGAWVFHAQKDLILIKYSCF